MKPTANLWIVLLLGLIARPVRANAVYDFALGYYGGNELLGTLTMDTVSPGLGQYSTSNITSAALSSVILSGYATSAPLNKAMAVSSFSATVSGNSLVNASFAFSPMTDWGDGTYDVWFLTTNNATEHFLTHEVGSGSTSFETYTDSLTSYSFTQVAVVPAPRTILLMSSGLLLLITPFCRRYRKN